MAGQVDWYTDFYFPLLRRWTARVRSAVANGSGHEKMVFLEPIPNEVRQFLSSLRSLAHANRG